MQFPLIVKPPIDVTVRVTSGGDDGGGLGGLTLLSLENSSGAVQVGLSADALADVVFPHTLRASSYLRLNLPDAALGATLTATTQPTQASDWVEDLSVAGSREVTAVLPAGASRLRAALTASSADATLSLHEIAADGTTWGLGGAVTVATGTTGALILPTAPAGSYAVIVQGSGTLNVTWNAAGATPATESITVNSGTPVTLNPPAGKVAGTLSTNVRVDVSLDGGTTFNLLYPGETWFIPEGQLGAVRLKMGYNVATVTATYA